MNKDRIEGFKTFSVRKKAMKVKAVLNSFNFKRFTKFFLIWKATSLQSPQEQMVGEKNVDISHPSNSGSTGCKNLTPAVDVRKDQKAMRNVYSQTRVDDFDISSFEEGENNGVERQLQPDKYECTTTSANWSSQVTSYCRIDCENL